MTGKLFLHIGRNKAGSTTVQNTWLRNIDTLRAAGIDYALFGQESPAGLALPSFASHMALAQHVRDHPAAVLVSHEGLCCFHPVFAAAMAADLAALDTTLIFYVRPYRDWVVSDYVFNVLIGRQTTDFDTYLDDLGDGVSFWPALSIWADAIGWDRVRVRSVHPADLAGGDLAVDAMAAIGLAPPPPGPGTRDNASPVWVTTELVRFLLTDEAETRPPFQVYDVAGILDLGSRIDHEVRAAAHAGMALGRGAYLTAAQSARLCDLYNADLDRLAERVGPRLRYDDGSAARPADVRPAVETIPAALAESLQAALGDRLAAGEFDDMVGNHRLPALLAILRGSA